MGTFSNISSIFTDIANSLRSKMGTSSTFTPAQMTSTINSMEVLEIPQGLPQTSSEGVIGYTGNNPSYISNKVVSTPYGDINITYGYNIKIDNGSINQIFEVTDASGLFSSNKNNVMNFDVIKFGNNVTDMSMTFYGCSTFNKPITIGNNVTSMGQTFMNCSNFNQPITIPNNVTTMAFTFMNCSNFNQPIIIPNNVTTMGSTFSGCSNFNQPIIIPNNVTNMASTFMNCINFNQPITIPNNVTTMALTFSGCSNFNQPIIIPNNVTNMLYTFYNCTNFGSSIYFKNSSKLTTFTSTGWMLMKCNNSLRKYIYCNNATPFISITNTQSIVGGAVTWSTMTNGYYNAVYNVYIYNNWTPS